MDLETLKKLRGLNNSGTTSVPEKSVSASSRQTSSSMSAQATDKVKSSQNMLEMIKRLRENVGNKEAFSSILQEMKVNNLDISPDLCRMITPDMLDENGYLKLNAEDTETLLNNLNNFFENLINKPAS